MLIIPVFAVLVTGLTGGLESDEERATEAYQEHGTPTLVILPKRSSGRFRGGGVGSGGPRHFMDRSLAARMPDKHEIRDETSAF